MAITVDFDSTDLGSIPSTALFGDVAQVVERSLSMREVSRSMLDFSILFLFFFFFFSLFGSHLFDRVYGRSDDL